MHYSKRGLHLQAEESLLEHRKQIESLRSDCLITAEDSLGLQLTVFGSMLQGTVSCFPMHIDLCALQSLSSTIPRAYPYFKSWYAVHTFSPGLRPRLQLTLGRRLQWSATEGAWVPDDP